MEFRWRWTAIPVAIYLALLVPHAWAADPAPPAPKITADTKDPNLIDKFVKAEAENLKNAANATEANVIRERMLTVFTPVTGKPAPSDGFKSNYALSAKHELVPLLDSDKPGVAINAIMVLAGIKYFDTDDALKNALTNKSPAIRLWAARGLGDIIVGVKGLGTLAFPRDVQALEEALTKETSLPVGAEIAKALAASGEAKALPAVGTFLDLLDKTFQRGAPDTTGLDAAADALNVAANLARGQKLAPKDVLPLAQSTVNIMGLSSQYLLDEVTVDKDKAENRKVLVLNVATAGVGLLNALTGGAAIALTPGAKPMAPDICSAINDVAGSPDIPGRAQAVVKDLKLPPKAKVGG